VTLPDVSPSVRALHQRLEAIAPHLIDDFASQSVGALLARLADAVAEDPSASRVWMLATAVAGGYPTSGEVLAMRRGLALATSIDRSGACLSAVAVTASAVHAAEVLAEVVVGGVVVDVDFCARNRHNTGIQRVVRNTVKHWDPTTAILAAWSTDGTGYRRLTPGQRALVTEWSSDLEPVAEPENDVLLIPVDGSVLLPEVPAHRYIERLSAIAEHSGNRTGLIGYDAIPLVSADFVGEDESDRFAHYLSIVKHSTVVSAISETTADEFRGFGDALAAQGLTGPRVTSLLLPTVSHVGATGKAEQRDVPLVLMVGSIEPRKNQLAVLAATESLWREGLDFELRVIGGGAAVYVNELEMAMARARSRGARVAHARGVDDAGLAAAYRDATAFVFPSLQEGYGLPVAEALASGTPAITSRYGSTAEIASFGGCILVDPRSDVEIADALREILTDDALRLRLVEQTTRLVSRDWSQYADELWHQLVMEPRA